MEEEKGFQIRDRRGHSQGEGESAARKAETAPPEKKGRQKDPGAPREEDSSESASFPVNFSSFILSLATSALIHLGEEASPATGERSIQLPMARQVIDLISLLEEKTKGNLAQEEETLLSQLLYTLRMKYVETEKKRHP